LVLFYFIVINFSQQRFCLVFQQAKAHVLSINNVHFFINNDVNAFGKRQKPVVGVVKFGDFAFFIHQKRHFIEFMFGNKIAVRFGGITAQAQNFDIALFVFLDVLLKLNKLFNSEASIIFGIKSEYYSPMLFQNFAKRP